MFLQRLELQGFKSFASKTVLDFPEGVTAVVGPNGSGKSNITDAIRWILGEREAKSLRGAKADDLIYAGTEKRARAGFAQASLYFDNSSGVFPIEYKEVVITRRIDRDGDSRFYINQSEMRLKDIVDFFARARLGARGLNIISQGESDAFLRANPLERRELIEEILGLKEYLLKKRRASRELKNTALNLDKAKSSVEEMRPHLQMLRRSVKRYEERDNIASELKSLEELYFGSKVRSIVTELSRLTPAIDEVERDINLKRGELSAAEDRLRVIESSEPETKKELEVIRLKRRELISERMALSPKVVPQPVVQKVARATETILREIRFSAEKALNTASIEELRDILRRIITSVDEVFAVPAPVEPSVEPTKDPVYEAKVAEFTRLFDELDAAEKKLSAGMEEFSRVFRSAMAELEKKKDELSRLSDKKERLTFEKEKLKYHEAELDNQLKAIGKSFAEYTSVEIASTEFDPVSIERRIYRLRNELASIGETDDSVVKEAKETEERYAFLTSQIEELEKASADLKALIKELDQKIHHEFSGAIDRINNELGRFAKILFGGGNLALRLEEPVSESPTEELLDGVMPPSPALVDEEGDEEPKQGIEIDVVLPKKRIKGLEVLSGGERSLLSVAILFGLVSISPPPFIVVDEVDAPLDEHNARLLGEILKHFEKKTQFIIVTHNRATMESADALYGVTMGEDGASRVVSLRLTGTNE